jgi:hypothetical protein
MVAHHEGHEAQNLGFLDVGNANSADVIKHLPELGGIAFGKAVFLQGGADEIIDRQSERVASGGSPSHRA